MIKWIQEIIVDLNFIKSHTLQPKWYKFLKVFLLLGLLAGYYALFGPAAVLIFSGVFFGLSTVVHIIYRVKTQTWTRSWLDFVVVEGKPERIGGYYYAAVMLNMVLAVVISLALT